MATTNGQLRRQEMLAFCAMYDYHGP